METGLRTRSCQEAKYWRQELSVYILVVDDEPDVEALFRQQFRRDVKSGRFTMEFAPSAPVAAARARSRTESLATPSAPARCSISGSVRPTISRPPIIPIVGDLVRANPGTISLGQGVVHCITEWAREKGFDLEGATMTVQGFGNVGSVAAFSLAKYGVKVVAVSDVDPTRLSDLVNRIERSQTVAQKLPK